MRSARVEPRSFFTPEPMSPVNRRGFVKTFLATAGASYVDRSEAIGLWGSETSEIAPTLEHGDQQLRLSGEGERLTFQNFLRAGNEWKPATLAAVPMVTGPSFPLVSSRMIKQAGAIHCEGTGMAQGMDGKQLEYAWKGEIKAQSPGRDAPPWFQFRTTLHLPAPIRLHQASQVEPQIVVWLNSISMLMEGQSGSWRRVILQQPTRNSLGAWGNDLPALYMLDQNAGVETMMYFDITEMDWMSMENLPRFLVYRCGNTSHIERDGTQRLGVGLIADQATGDVLPAGDVRFSYWLLQRPVTTLFNERQAVSRWMQALLPLFEEKLAWPACAGKWKDFAAGTVRDLQDKSAQVEVNGHIGLRAYVKGSSQLWKQPADNFELMTVADVLWPSLLYLQLHSTPSFDQECKELVADLPGMYRAETHSISNSYLRQENERADSWYPFENGLIKYPMIGSLAGAKEVTAHFMDAFETARKMAHQYDYLFPIYYRVATLEAEGAGTNYAVGGLYAWGALIAHRLSGDAEYREEAKRAIRALCTVASDRLFHEPQELAFGALAAADLGLREEAAYLLYEQLRMFYWYSDPSQKSHDIRGMVQAAASILYPAFKENVEAILPWTGIMKRGIVFEGLLRFMDQQRRNNFSFFEGCSTNRGGGAMSRIPFENLGTLELGGQTGNVGKEIYGAGECLWMYLMFEALGQISDRELMLVSLDLVDVFDATKFPAHELEFILYNPTAETRSATISIPPAKGGRVRLTADGKIFDEQLRVPPRGIVRVEARF